MMSLVLMVLGMMLVAWGGMLLLTGEFVATLDIAASLVSSGFVVIALAAIVRTLDRLVDRFPAPDEMEEHDADPVLAPAVSSDSTIILPGVLAESEPQLSSIAVEAEPERPSAERSSAAAPSSGPVAIPPSMIREGAIDGRVYRFFDDGSIEAEGPDGLRRFGSMAEAREAILHGRTPVSEGPTELDGKEISGSAEVKPEVKLEIAARQPIFQAPIKEMPPEPATPTPIGPSAAAASVRPETDRAVRKPVTWESYLAAGRVQEGGDKTETEVSAPPVDPMPEPAAEKTPAVSPPSWSEPFRALLQGDDAAKADTKKKPNG